jgi:formate-nitrite transporter family protein
VTGGRLELPVGERDHVTGLDDAPVTLVEYGDFECPYCGMAYPIVRSIQRQLGNRLRFVYRHFPLKERHPHAQHAAEAAESAAAQGKFWEMHAALFEHQDALEDEALRSYALEIGLDGERVERDLESGTYARRVRDDFRSGVRSGVNGTPTFFVNGERYDGPWMHEAKFLSALREAVDEAEAGRARV